MWGCGAPSAPSEEVGLRVALTESCAPADDVQLTLIAEGHYPARDALFAPLRISDDTQRLPDFPGDTLAYRLEARGGRYDGAGRTAAVPGATADVLVLPFGEPCVAGRLSSGSFGRGSAAPFGDSELLWLSAEAGRGTRRITPARAAVSAPSEPLFVPRAGASVTPTGDGVLVVGGAQLDSPDAPALASFERFVPALDGFDDVGRLEQARAYHAAVRSSDGVVWVAGGRDGQRLLASVERVGLGRSGVDVARASDQLALLAASDASVVALDFQGSGPPSVQLFDARGQQRIDAADLPVATTPSLVVALVGERLLSFEVDAEGRTTGRACLRFGKEQDECLDDWLTSFAGFAEARAVALRDGRVVLVGKRHGSPALRLVDVGRRVVEVRALPFVPVWAGLLGDGSVALVGDEGVALLREDALSATVELPATLLAPDAPLLALDSVDHWRWEGLSLVARAARAEAHLAAVRLVDLALVVEADGPLDVSFSWDSGARHTVRIEARSIDVFGTELSRDEGGPVRIERRGDTWRVQAGGQQGRRVVPGLTEPARLSLRAPERGTRVTRFEVERL